MLRSCSNPALQTSGKLVVESSTKRVTSGTDPASIDPYSTRVIDEGFTCNYLYLVDNRNLKAPTLGLGWRFSKSIVDTVEGNYVPWATLVRGTPTGDGWLQVGERYLPMVVNGKSVLSKQDLREDAQCSAACLLPRLAEHVEKAKAQEIDKNNLQASRHELRDVQERRLSAEEDLRIERLNLEEYAVQFQRRLDEINWKSEAELQQEQQERFAKFGKKRS